MKSRLTNTSGVSMMELMIVVVIIGLLAAMAAPNLDGAIKKIKFNNVGREIISSMRLARSSAITLQVPHGIYFNEDTHEMLVFLDKTDLDDHSFASGDSVLRCDTISHEVDYLFATFPNQSVVFNPDGSASSTGDIFCYQSESASCNSFSIYLTAATGRAKLEIYEY